MTSLADAPDLLALRSPTHPARALPRLLRRLMPVVTSEAGWARFRHEDLGGLSEHQRAMEARQLEVALGLLGDPDDAPVWVLGRLELLRIPNPGGRRRVLR